MTARATLDARGPEKGAILIQVAISILVLTAMSAFVVDYGVLWLARRQAQNAADAGALAGAVSLAFDNSTDVSSTGSAYLSAVKAAQANQVNGTTPGVHVDLDPTTMASWDHAAPAACPTSTPSCVQVDTYADGTHGSTALPVYFAALFGQTSQNMRATATAWTVSGNSTDCMRPFAVVDKWAEHYAPTTEFDHWYKSGSNAVSYVNPDVYIPPFVTSSTDPGTGYTTTTDVGTEVLLKGGNNPNSSTGAMTPGWFLPVDLPDGSGGYLQGANDYSNAIKTCIGNPVTIGDYLPTETGAMIGPTSQGVQTDSNSLVNQDPNASWNTTTNTVQNSCAPSAACGAFSPRIVPIAVFDMDEFQWRSTQNDWTTAWTPGVGPGAANTFSCPGGGRCIRVTNILGFFVETMSGQDVTGRIVNLPGDFVTGGSNVGGGGAFLHDIQLIR